MGFVTFSWCACRLVALGTPVRCAERRASMSVLPIRERCLDTADAYGCGVAERVLGPAAAVGRHDRKRPRKSERLSSGYATDRNWSLPSTEPWLSLQYTGIKLPR